MPFSVSSSYAQVRSILDASSSDTLPAAADITKASASLATSLPPTGLGEEAVAAHLCHDIIPGFNGPKTSSHYYGFVIGGVLPVAELADHIVTAFDQNVHVHLPEQSVATLVEDRALGMLLELLRLGPEWKGRTFTTGATGANILGLACGREAVIEKRLQGMGKTGSVGELGLLEACMQAQVKGIQILTTMGHSSLYKAASVVGIGRAFVKDLPQDKADPWKLNLELLEAELKRSEAGVLSIVALSAGEVNTGRWATSGVGDVAKVRELCDRYGAWLHADAAFGAFARALPTGPEFSTLLEISSGLELADSITGDCHKMLNVPYDCGFFLTRSTTTLSAVFQNPNAAYLSGGATDVPSPLNIGMENSRRFRALPVYAVLQAYGRNGFADIFARQVRLARAVSEFLRASEDFDLLPGGSVAATDGADGARGEGGFGDVHIIVIFRAKENAVNERLVKRINDTRRVYVSGTKWEGKPACRIAVSTWRVEVERDTRLIVEVLEQAVRE